MKSEEIPKSRDPRIGNLINQIINENIINEDPLKENVEKIQNFFKIAESTLYRLCKKQIEDAKKFTNYPNNGEEIEYKKGNEKEGKLAIDKLNRCQEEIEGFISTFQGLGEMTTSIMENQMNLCVDDCEENIVNIPNYDDHMLKQCLVSCYKGTNYTNKSSIFLLGEQAEYFTHELDKL